MTRVSVVLVLVGMLVACSIEEERDHGPGLVIYRSGSTAICDRIVARSAINAERRLEPGPNRLIRCIQPDGYFDIRTFEVGTIKWPAPTGSARVIQGAPNVSPVDSPTPYYMPAPNPFTGPPRSAPSR